MNLKNETLKKLCVAFGVLTTEHNSGEYLRECSRTTGTPFQLHELFDDLDDIKDAGERIVDRAAAGECTKCGCLSYEITKKRAKMIAGVWVPKRGRKGTK